VLADRRLCGDWGSTALTRGREANHLYVVADCELERDEFAPRGLTDDNDPIGALARALERSEAQPLALDHGRSLQTPSRAREGFGLER
jgi:hypothetical protein